MQLSCFCLTLLGNGIDSHSFGLPLMPEKLVDKEKFSPLSLATAIPR